MTARESADYLKLDLAGHRLTAAWAAPDRARGAVVIAHGRVNDLDHPSLIAAAKAAVEAGWAALRFNFPYRERAPLPGGVSAEPDHFGTLIAVHRAAAEWALSRTGGRLVMAGKSLGGRSAAAAVKGGHGVAGLFFLGFPLHPPGRYDQVRAEALAGLDRPMLFIQGGDDELCRLDLLRDVIDRLDPRPALAVIEGVGHGFDAPPGDPRPPEEIMAGIEAATYDFLTSLD